MFCGRFETTLRQAFAVAAVSVDPAIVATVKMNDCLVLSIGHHDWRYLWRYTGPLQRERASALKCLLANHCRLRRCGQSSVRENVFHHINLQFRVRAVYLCEGFCVVNRSVLEYVYCIADTAATRIGMLSIFSACKHAKPVKVMLSSNASCCSVTGLSIRVSGSHGQL